MRSADVIQIARRRAGLSQQELADKLGRPRSNVTRWEAGTVKPSFETLSAVVRACGLDATVGLFALDRSNDGYIRELLGLTPAERIRHQVAAANGIGRLTRGVAARNAGLEGDELSPFDPVELLREIAAPDAMLMGRLAANLRGSPVVPSDREVTLLPRDAAARERVGHRIDALGGLAWESSEERPIEVPLELRRGARADRWVVARFGSVLAVVEGDPPGTAGFADLRKDATTEQLSGGVDILVPSLIDLVRMADASPWPQDRLELPTLRRALEIGSESELPPIEVPVGLEDLFAAHGIR